MKRLVNVLKSLPIRIQLGSIQMRLTLRCGFTLLIWATPAAGQQRDSLSISTGELGARLRFLSSDLFEGRYPGTRGEALTVQYLVSELEGFGVRPGASPVAGDSIGNWLQPVSILTHQPDSTSPNTARLSGRVTRSLKHGRDIRLSNFSALPEVRAGGELVFVGYGIHAPMYGWNDFAGADLRGKIAVAMFGEPAPAGDTLRFNGVRASRFSWPTDKLAEMERRGAVGVLWLWPHDSLPQGPVAGYRQLASDVTDVTLVLTGLLTDSVLAGLLPQRAPPLGKLLEAAAKPGFRSLTLGVWLNVHLRTKPATVTTHNVVGVVPGVDSGLTSDHVVLSAHWDAYGIGPPVDGDSIYNGALDDGSGTTALLALARVFARHPQRRSLTFLFTTAEEWGLLGAHAFVCAGSVPASRIAANLNLDDGFELFGVKRDAAPLGVELSTLGATVAQVAAKTRLRVAPDPFPQEGFFLRADNYPFARAGIPALYMALGTDVVGGTPGFFDQKAKEYLEKHYHQPSDDYETTVLDLEGSRQYAEFARDLTIAVANASTRPAWVPKSEFQRPTGGVRRGARCIR